MKGSLDLGVFSTKIPRKLKIFVNWEYLFTMSRDFYQMAQKPALYHQKGHLSIQFKLNLFFQNEKTFLFFNADRNNPPLKKSMKSLEIKYVLF